jgi:rhodanese-related sulfurtransferase
MTAINDILSAAHGRAKRLRLPYSGALTPKEAHDLLQQAPGARLVDVRTRAELDWVGRIPGAVELEWLTYPGSKPNPDFPRQLKQQVDSESLVMFICRSGGRSHAAAAVAMQVGYTEVYNVLEGFEGDKDAQDHRNTVGGWRHAGLPWSQT